MDGTNDEVQINQALDYVDANASFTTVYLKSNTYNIDGQMQIHTETTLTGDSDAVVRLVDSAGWAQYVPIFKEGDTVTNNITIHGFEIDGNHDNQGVSAGTSYYEMISLEDSFYVEIYDMYLHDGSDDAVFIDADGAYAFTPVYASVHDNIIYHPGHEGIYFMDCSNVTAYDNTITCRTNSGIRIDDTNNATAYNNTITATLASGNAGIQIQKINAVEVDDIEIYDNHIENTNIIGIQVVAASTIGTSTPANSNGVYIHHNVIKDCGQAGQGESAGINIQGFNNTIIENNVIDGNYQAGIITQNTYLTVSSTGYETFARNNIITGTIVQSGDGYAVENRLDTTHSITLENNCFYDNDAAGTSGTNITESGTITSDPLYYDSTNDDYHLQSVYGRWDGSSFVTTDTSTSPCIDAGLNLSTFSNEPDYPSGSQNIGRYGGTIYASYGSSMGSTADTKFEYWNGTAWVEDELLYYLWFPDIFRWCTYWPNAEQSASQPTLRITNNGTGAGTPYMWLNTTPPATVKIWVDNDNIWNGDTIELDTTHKQVNTELANGSNVTLWAWASTYGYDGTFDFEINAEVV